MNARTIRAHLKPFVIKTRRKTTIRHAFASAIAPVQPYDETRVISAMELLNQQPADLTCVYCDSPAETWDHLESTVKNQEFSGFGHCIGNLVPCCKQCNSKKANRPWRDFMATKHAGGQLSAKVALIERYQLANNMPGTPYDTIKQLAPHECAEYESLQSQILELVDRADVMAKSIRDAVGQALAQCDQDNPRP